MSKPLTLESLPVTLRQVGLGDVECDARHLAHLLDSALEPYQRLSVAVTPDEKSARDKLGAALWIARDLAEILQWKLERMDDENHLQPKGKPHAA